MRVCPTCEREHADDVRRCPDDGTALVRVPVVDPLVGRDVDGRFTLHERLGAGAMGAVYRAVQHSMGRSVAIKVMHPSGPADEGAIQRFHREARALSRLNHPHTIRIFDFGQTADGLLYLVMELLDGAPLSAHIRTAPGGMAPERAVDLVVQACESVADAHQLGVLHRDLKPDNMFVGARVGRADFVTVLDFGISKVLDAAEPSLTGTGASFGTPLYMSPEAVLGRQVDGRTDVYSLGVILFELLAGRAPFTEGNATAVMISHATAPPPPLPERNAAGPIPPALAAVVQRALSKDVEGRPATPIALADELRAAIGAPAPPGARPTGETPVVPRAGDRTSAATWAAGLDETAAPDAIPDGAVDAGRGAALDETAAPDARPALDETAAPDARPALDETAVPDVRPALDETGAATASVDPAAGPTSRARRGPALWAGGLAIVGVAAAAVWGLRGPPSGSEPPPSSARRPAGEGAGARATPPGADPTEAASRREARAAGAPTAEVRPDAPTPSDTPAAGAPLEDAVSPGSPSAALPDAPPTAAPPRRPAEPEIRTAARYGGAPPPPSAEPATPPATAGRHTRRPHPGGATDTPTRHDDATKAGLE